MARARVVLLGWCALFLVAAGSTAPGLPPPGPSAGAKDETAERVGRLIAALGSPSFAERERAGRALEAVGVPALPALRAAARHADPEVRRRTGEVVGRIENSLEALALAYREHGLPLPPPDAPLVLYSSGEKDEEPTLAFLLRPPTREAPPEFLNGLSTLKPRYELEITPLKPGALSAKAAAALVSRARLDQDDALTLAVQCHARGWEELARALFAHGREKTDEGPPRTVLLRAAWDYWWRELGRPATDWSAIARRLRALRAADGALDTEENRELLASLEAALVPSKARPGTIEAMIDDLIQERNTWYEPTEGAPQMPPSKRLFEQGFAAVPHLIDHLEDGRLTRYLWVSGGVSGIPHAPFYFRVGDHVGYVLARVSGSQVGRRSTRAEVEAWWVKARKLGEEAYWVRHALREGAVGTDSDLVRQIGRKYPRRLAELYRTLLDRRPDLDSDDLAQAIGTSSLPRGEKVALLAPATRHKGAGHRLAALERLADLAPDLFAERLVESLDGVPAPKWDDPRWRDESAFAWLATRTADPRVWQALEKATRRSGVALRLEFLQTVAAPWGAESPYRKERLALLAAFLDDTAVRDLTRDVKRDAFFAAGKEFPCLEVRNFAAMGIAGVLGLPANPRPEWGEADWAWLRRVVREVLRRP
jgi:hypothetical protein